MPRPASFGLLFLLFPLLTGCRQSAPATKVVETQPMPLTAEELDQAILGGSRRLRAAGAKFGLVLNKFLRKEKLAPGAMQQGYDAVLATVDDVTEDIRGVAPPDSESARALYNIYEQYLETQKQACENEFANIVRLVDNEELGFNEKKNAILPILQASTEDDERALSTVRKARRRFAEHHQLSWLKEENASP